MAITDGFGLKRSLFLITDPDLPIRESVELAHAGIRGGATHVVVRRPGDLPAKVYEAATRLSPVSIEGASWRMLVHDRIDIALATHAQGAMIPLNGIPGGPAKDMLLGNERMLGISVHSLEEARSAQLQLADFVLFGNVYETESHPGKRGEGLDALAYVAETIGIPVIAIGGITAERVDGVLEAGASGIAVIRAVSRVTDPVAAARAIRERLDAATYRHLDERTA